MLVISMRSNLQFDITRKLAGFIVGYFLWSTVQSASGRQCYPPGVNELRGGPYGEDSIKCPSFRNLVRQVPMTEGCAISDLYYRKYGNCVSDANCCTGSYCCLSTCEGITRCFNPYLNRFTDNLHNFTGNPVCPRTQAPCNLEPTKQPTTTTTTTTTIRSTLPTNTTTTTTKPTTTTTTTTPTTTTTTPSTPTTTPTTTTTKPTATTTTSTTTPTGTSTSSTTTPNPRGDGYDDYYPEDEEATHDSHGAGFIKEEGV